MLAFIKRAKQGIQPDFEYSKRPSVPLDFELNNLLS
jgi:hypothetical protein